MSRACVPGRQSRRRYLRLALVLPAALGVLAACSPYASVEIGGAFYSGGSVSIGSGISIGFPMR